MRRALGCNWRASVIVSATACRVTTALASGGNPDRFQGLPGPARKHQSRARPKLRAVSVEELQGAFADRDNHVKPKSRVFLGEKRDQLGLVSLDLEALRIERLGKVDNRRPDSSARLVRMALSISR